MTARRTAEDVERVTPRMKRALLIAAAADAWLDARKPPKKPKPTDNPCPAVPKHEEEEK